VFVIGEDIDLGMLARPRAGDAAAANSCAGGTAPVTPCCRHASPPDASSTNGGRGPTSVRCRDDTAPRCDGIASRLLAAFSWPAPIESTK